MSVLALPPHVEQVLAGYFTAELTTYARDRTAITTPVVPLWQPGSGQVLLTAGIGLPQKLYNISRDARVALLYSDPTASGMADSPAVLIQGEAALSGVVTWDDELAEVWQKTWRAQPKGVGVDPLSRRLLFWYYLRVKIRVTPRRVLWWPEGDMNQRPNEILLP